MAKRAPSPVLDDVARGLPAPGPDALAATLGAWYERRKRALPWRDEPTPYRVWISEIMLQQTQVATVLPYFERFVDAFPNVESLAAADESEVLSLWSGLGYYRRARMLHAAAKVVVARFGGGLPRTVEELTALPGVGRYTAGAIASIAFGVRAPVLDGNVARVISRLVALDEPVDGGVGQRALWALADGLVPAASPSTHNQAMMELGALVCTPRSPDCAACPWSKACAACAAGRAEDFPRKKPRAAPKAVAMVAGYLAADLASDRVLLARRPSEGLFGGLWELPAVELASGRSPRKASLERMFEERLGLGVEVGGHLCSLEHQLTHRTLSLEVYEVFPRGGSGVAGGAPASWYTDMRWVTLAAERDEVPLSTLTRKALAAARLRGSSGLREAGR